ncbi:sugar-binding protein [Rubellicoccus peritrichatus]|uniref:Sugar-binding protein n=1 Tax=Rubellicoccus peritrichatus TaxID=3080537 RepID=A0AAQ3LFH9_9BACT|nr:sugar-binding protein [Puniceicoccus sp. CR14]WOO43614.1 sugar-binding protein [Puniceicoccus sp. CR14]
MPHHIHNPVLILVFLVVSSFGLQAQESPMDMLYAEDFDGIVEDWDFKGSVELVEGDAFAGESVLLLSKTEANLREEVVATGPLFDVSSGTLEVTFATRSNLESWDNSYNGTLSLRFFNKDGEQLSTYELGAWYRMNPWNKGVVQVAVPDGAAKACLIASINKETTGDFGVDNITVSRAEDSNDDNGLRRMMFTMSQLGHLLYPEDDRTAEVEVWSTEPLSDELREAIFTVSDYWGAEQNHPIHLELEPAGEIEDPGYFVYKTTVDLSDVPLEVGRYYELHGEIAPAGQEAFSNYTAFAILPEATTNQYEPSEVPFTSRTWDQRIKESPLLTHRLGMRICNVWGRMWADPERVQAIQIDVVNELGMAVLTSAPSKWVEDRDSDWEELLQNDGALIRQGVRNFFDKYGHIKPMMVILGNEPHSKGDDVKVDVEAYRIVYTEIKKIDPSVLVVGTSIGLNEDYFKAGFGEWCDVYNFHSYEDPEGVRDIVENGYPAMFEKYGFPKPVWSTELGMNSQGMARLAVAGLLYKKFANFFAGGGANASWFGLFYPDPNARIHNSFASAHNVFDCRYSKYAPKLDAIAYYNAVNGIGIKKFVTDKVYVDGEHLFLFRDVDGRSLIIAYNEEGRHDVFIPMPDVSSVDIVRIDGSRDQLDARGKGISLTIGEDPILISYGDGPGDLPEKLEVAPIRFSDLPVELNRHINNQVGFTRDGIGDETIELKLPPFWEVERAGSVGQQSAFEQFSIQVPADSRLREATLDVLISGDDQNGRPIGLLTARIPVVEELSIELLPVPAVEQDEPGVKLVIQNNSLNSKDLTWKVVLEGEQSLKEGKYTRISDTDAHFMMPATGFLSLPARESSEIYLPIDNTEPVAVYHVKATVRDQSGNVISRKRPVAGFIPVFKLCSPLVIDGVLDEEKWDQAPVEVLDKSDYFFGFKGTDSEAPRWEGPDDLSASIRYLWDDDYLYIGVEVTDDVAGELKHQDSRLWRMDGLQFLVDPARREISKPGKYEYSVGRGAKGIQAWCTLSADSDVATGEVHDIQVAILQRGEGVNGDVTYEIAIPWSRLAPFDPVAGNNLGFTMIVNDDDGSGRNAFMTWFGNAHNKDIDTVGDLILLP